MGKIKTNRNSFSISGDNIRDIKRTSVPLFAENLYATGGTEMASSWGTSGTIQKIGDNSALKSEATVQNKNGLAQNNNGGNSSSGNSSIAQGAMGSVDILGTAVSGFKNAAALKSLSPIKAQADTLGNVALGTSRESLLNDWSTTAGMQDHYRAKDFATMNVGQHILAGFSNSAKGFSQMAAVSGGNPYAMAAGAIIGGVSSNLGSLRSIGMAKKRARQASELAVRTNNRLNSTFVNSAQQMDEFDSRNYLNNIAVLAANGGGIHIAKSKEGTFTAAASRHNMGVQEFASKVLANKSDYSSAMVKKANFARNASKWHDMGGYLFDEGGNLMSTHGGDFTNGLKYIDEGGTHESNPNNGVLMGMDSNGTPNLVEQGEVVYNDYVFSNRLSPDSELLEQFNLPDKYKNSSFAKIANELSTESKERMNDPISLAGLQENMVRLHDAQETYKQQNGLNPPEQQEQVPQEQPQEQVPEGQEEQVLQEEGQEEGQEEEPNTFDNGGKLNINIHRILTHHKDSPDTVNEDIIDRIARRRARANYIEGTVPFNTEYERIKNGLLAQAKIAVANNTKQFNKENDLKNLVQGLSQYGIKTTSADYISGMAPDKKPIYNEKALNRAIWNLGLSVDDFRNRYNAFKYAKEHGENVTFDPHSKYGIAQKLKSDKVKAKVIELAKPHVYSSTNTTTTSTKSNSNSATTNTTTNTGSGTSNTKATSSSTGARTSTRGTGSGTKSTAVKTNPTGTVNSGNTEKYAYDPSRTDKESDNGNESYMAKRQYVIDNFKSPEVQDWIKNSYVPAINNYNKEQGTENYKPVTADDVTLDAFTVNSNDGKWGAWHNAVLGLKDPSVKSEALPKVTSLDNINPYVNRPIPYNTKPQNKKNRPLPTWMRYAPVVANSVNEALLKKDYSDVDNFLEQTKNVRTVKATPIGDYITPNYISPWEVSTPIERQMAATRHGIINNSAGNQATATAGLIASDYDMIGKIGAGYLSGKEYNNSQTTNATSFNRDTNKFNAESDLSAQNANMNLNNYYLNRAAQEYQYRNAIDAQYNAAISAAETNAAESLGNIGLENYYINQTNAMYPEYPTNRYGTADYVKPYEYRSSKLGGKIKTKKRR